MIEIYLIVTFIGYISSYTLCNECLKNINE